MNNIDSLHVLIHSMSKSEKRHFKLSQLGIKKNNYTKLFDAIEKQEIYNELLIKKKLRAESFIEYLPVVKHQLQEKILENLRKLHSNKDLHIEVFNKLTDASTLYQRGLKELGHKELDKAFEIIKERELYELMPIYMRKKVAFWQEERFIEVSEQAITSLENETVNFLEATIGDVKMLGTMQRFSKVSKCIGYINNDADTQLFATILGEPILKDVNNLKTLRGTFNFYFVKSLFYSANKNAEKCIENAIACLEITQKKAEQSHYFLNPYILALGNALEYSIAFRQHDYYQFFKAQLENIEEKIDKVPMAGANRRMESLRATELQYFLLSNEENKEAKTQKLLQKVKNIDTSNASIHTSTLLLYIAYAHLTLKEFYSCIEYLDKRDDINRGETTTLSLPSAIIRIICHFEMNNFEYLESLLRNTKRALEKHNVYNESEALFFQFIRKMVRFNKDKQKLLETKKQFLQALQTPDHIDWTVKIFFNFESWLK